MLLSTLPKGAAGTLPACAMAAWLAWGGAWPTLAGAQSPVAASVDTAAASQADAPRRYDIPAGDLASVIEAYANQAGVLLSVDARLLAGLSSQGLRGHYGVRQGFAALLAGHRFEAAPNAAGIYTLRRMPAAPVSELAPVQVLGQGERDPADEPYRTAGSSHYLSRERIERFRGTSVGDIFQGTPGVLVAENRNSGGLDINIRGMQGQGRVPVLVDGARQETTVYRGYAGVSSRSYVDPDLIGGIMIEKGPSMSAQGTGAVGGLISMRTLSAEDIVKPGKDFGIRLRGSAIGNTTSGPLDPGTPGGYRVRADREGAYRTDCVAGLEALCANELGLGQIAPAEGMDRPGLLKPTSWAGSVALAKRWDRVDLVAAYAQRSLGNYYAGRHGPAATVDLSDRHPVSFWTDVYAKLDGATRFRAGERIVNTNFESKSALVKARLYLPREQTLELSWMRYRSAYGQLMPSQLQWLGQAAQTNDSRVTVQTYGARYHWQPGNDWLDLRANAWHTNTNSLNENYAAANSTSGLSLASNSAERYRRTGVDLSNRMRLWGARVTLDYGVAGQWERLGAADTDFFLTGATSGRAGQRDEYSAFGAARWQMLPSLALDAGWRYSRFKTRDQNAVDPALAEASAGGSAPMVGLTWEPVAGLQFYGRYAEALRMPSLFETTAGFSVSPSQDVTLRPERAKNKEVGINYARDGWLGASDKLRLKLAYFRNDTTDYLTRTLPNTWESGYGKQFFTMRNIDSASFHGVELSGSYDLGRVFVELGGTRYTRIETCYVGSFRRLACTDYGIAESYVNNMIPPKWHASVTLGTRWLDRRLTVGMRATLMGRRNPQPEYNDQSKGGLAVVPWHSYRLYDLFASYRVNDTVSVDFNIDNLTDRYYLDALSLGLVPSPGRTARLSVTAQF